MATFVQWHFQPAESREGDIMMSILTQAHTTNVQFLEKRLGKINPFLKRIKETKQLTQKNQTFVDKLITGINETMRKKTPKEKLNSWKVICDQHDVESFEKQAKVILKKDFKKFEGVKLLEVLAAKLEEKARAKGHIKTLKKFKGSTEINHAKQLKGDRLAKLKEIINNYVPAGKEIDKNQFNAIVCLLLPDYIPKNPQFEQNYKKLKNKKREKKFNDWVAERNQKNKNIHAIFEAILPKKKTKLTREDLIEWLWKGLTSNVSKYKNSVSDVKKLAFSIRNKVLELISQE